MEASTWEGTTEEEDDGELQALFLEEADELLNEANELLERWDAEGFEASRDGLLRILHTLKGAARLAGLAPVADLSHALESLLEKDVGDDALRKTRTRRAVDDLLAMVDVVRAGDMPDSADEAIARLSERADEVPDELPGAMAEDASDEMTVATAVEAPETELPLDFEPEDREILDIYLEEAQEILQEQEDVLALWSEEPTNLEHIHLLQRQLHTIKGGARLSGLTAVADVAHELETLFEQVAEGRRVPDNGLIALAREGQETLQDLVDAVHKHSVMKTANGLLARIRAYASGQAAPVAVQQQPERRKADVVQLRRRSSPGTEGTDKAAPQKPAARPTQLGQVREMIRVDAGTLENLANLAGETSIYRSRLEQQVSSFRFHLEEIDATVERVRAQLRNLEIETEAQVQYRREMAGFEDDEFDPLEMDRYTRQQELTRGLGESTNDLVALKDTLESLAADAELLLLQQSRVDSELQDRLMRTRLVPFTSIVPRLRRMVRQIGEELKKPVQLSIQAEGEMDRTILERLIAPIEHMLRNAIDHGIESPAERKKLKKPEQGRVGIRLYREGAEVVVEIADDGRGIDLDKVRAKAIERGLIAPDASLTDHELQLMILEAGFSTADKVTQISGRGVGMDVVNSEIKQMGGLIDIQSQRGQGTTIIARLPFTVSVNQALMVKSGDEVYAIPLTNIEGIVRVSPYELMEYYNADDPVYMYAGEPYALRYLGKLLDPAAKPNLEGLTRPLPLLLLHGVEHPVALQVDELQGSREIVVKSVGTQLSSITGLSGATILGDGRVVLILDLPALWRRADAPVVEAEAKAKQLAEQEVEKAPTVMVVDDSITVRKVTSRLLQRHGFDVITAKDGVDAVNVLHDRIPDVMLLDIEMPRMDGFELATMIRHDDRLRHLPIVMITSRTGDKHRSRAEAIGVDRYMGKPYNEVDLLRTIEDLLGR